ncbi:hypothetical protein LOTGIDRAFT_227806 [Lottia gigantea]|uniref:Methyltransferase type 11 domain-containing protein n=1 Tax=Lottia gigantea TaxID=225164 RepID=V4BBW1_LOTGI|nr:hypothetical protein LOTGIDRAFT_227806 [Lottia gigantea]ESP05111.1 hypothetical protein LOTGIDRAFT_227806 [Lottia gigantea]
MSIRLFEAAKHAELYAKFRPKYDQDVFDAILNFCKKGKCEFEQAVDVGCGSGQSTVPLTKFFKRVLGSDISAKQIENAPRKIKNLEYHVGPAEDLSFLSNSSTDLVTIAQAVHWFDTERFYSEVNRVLKPGGGLVVYAYGSEIMENKTIKEKISRFYSETLGDFWNEKVKLVEEEHYSSLTLPFPGWYRKDDLKIRVEWTVEEYVGYVSSRSGWTKYLKHNPESDELQKLLLRFKELYTVDGTERKMKIEFPVFMLMGYKPQ